MAATTGVLLLYVGTTLPMFMDVGYPDSATLLKVRELVHTGVLYGPFDKPPYLVTIYGPLTYILLAIFYSVAEACGWDPQIAVRIGVLLSFVGCLTAVFAIARRAFGSATIGSLSVLFATSVVPFALWATQIRGDFAGTFFSLSGTAFFLESLDRRNHRIAYGGAILCFAAALLTKQTFVAAPTAITVWLAFRKQWSAALLFAGGVVLLAVLGYFVVWLREPAMLEHYAAVQNPVLDFRGARAITIEAMRQLLVPFSVAGLVASLSETNPRTRPLIAVGAASWMIAGLTAAQVGANINYFAEPLLLSSVAAGKGLHAVHTRFSRRRWLLTAFAMVLAVGWFIPTLRNEQRVFRKALEQRQIARYRRGPWDRFASAVSGQRVLSTIPAISVLGVSPEMPDPFLNSVLEMRGKWSSRPIVESLNRGRYDVVVIWRDQLFARGGYRGVPLWNARIRSSVASRYRRACFFYDWEIWVPR
ncbi:MAG TPA: hypothetical protein VHM24_02580, partial [Gemmatimonadaceae bacterium]|nr:hypothetical protein [Gemmatimonadaceae bacterium]